MTVVVLYLCFYCISFGESCACKSDSQAREPAAAICPSFIATARPITILWMFSHVGPCFTPKKWIKSASFLCAFECVSQQARWCSICFMRCSCHSRGLSCQFLQNLGVSILFRINSFIQRGSHTRTSMLIRPVNVYVISSSLHIHHRTALRCELLLSLSIVP